MASASVAAIGTILKRNAVLVAEALEINGPEQSLEHVDVTNMDSPSFFMEILPTIKKPGVVVVEFNYIAQNATQKGVLTDYQNRTLQVWTITFSDAAPTIASFSAYVTKWHPIAKVKDQLKLQVELTISGAVTYTP
jgi:predicted secreted protein